MPTTLPRRPYGPNQLPLSIVGMGGIVVKDLPQNQANRIVAQAVERGVNYYDVAPGYGTAEQILGPALQPFRNDCFLACKTGQRTAAPAREEFERSCQRLRTDYFDLYQLHGITKLDADVDAAFASDGVMKLINELKRDGRIRHVGFSAHSVEAALVAMERYDFDSVLFPINYAAYFAGDFGDAVIAEATQRGVSILALKALARERWPEDDPLRSKYANCWYKPLTDPHLASLALRFALSQPITAAIPPGAEDLFWLAVEIAEQFQPIDDAGLAELRELAPTVEPVFKR